MRRPSGPEAPPARSRLARLQAGRHARVDEPRAGRPPALVARSLAIGDLCSSDGVSGSRSSQENWVILVNRTRGARVFKIFRSPRVACAILSRTESGHWRLGDGPRPTRISGCRWHWQCGSAAHRPRVCVSLDAREYDERSSLARATMCTGCFERSRSCSRSCSRSRQRRVLVKTWGEGEGAGDAYHLHWRLRRERTRRWPRCTHSISAHRAADAARAEPALGSSTM